MTGPARRVPPYWATLAAITALGGLLRFAFLAREPLWRDEAFTAVVTGRPLGEMLAAVAQDSAPPLSYVLDHFLVPAGGAPWMLRVVPAIAGTALIVLLASVARRIHGDAAGLWAAAFVAVLPTTVLASRDARMYALAGMLAVGALLALWRALERPDGLRWSAYGLLVALAAWTDYFAVIAVLATLAAAAWWLAPARRTIATATLVTGAALATLLPWLAVARAQFGHAGASFWVPPLGPATVAGTLAQLLSGPPVDAGTPSIDPLRVLQGIAILSGAVALAALVVRRGRLAEPERRAAAFCASAALVGVLALVILSLWRPLLEARYAGVLWLPLFALAGVGLSLLRPPAATLVVVGLVVPSLALSVAVTHPRTDLLIPEISARLGPADLVVAHPSQYLMLLDLGDVPIRSRLRIVGDHVPWFWGTAAYPSGAVVSAVPAEVVRDRGRILYVAQPSDGPPDLPPGYRRAERICQVGACLTVYAPGAG